MMKSKSFLIVGEVIHRDGKATRTLPAEKDKVLNEFFKQNRDVEVIDIETNVNFGGQDVAMVTILFKEEDSKSRK
jgi:hypothetical protein